MSEIVRLINESSWTLYTLAVIAAILYHAVSNELSNSQNCVARFLGNIMGQFTATIVILMIALEAMK